MSDNVFPITGRPSASRSTRPESSFRENEIQRVRDAIKALRRKDGDIFAHLAVSVHNYLARVEQRGSRTGAIGLIIGGDRDPSARHRKRYSWDGHTERSEPLCKNGGLWLDVIERCARELGEEPGLLLLDAVSGSRLRPQIAQGDYRSGDWIAAFEDLMGRLEQRLLAIPGIDRLFDYLGAAHLEVDAGKLVEAENSTLFSGFDSQFPLSSSYLDQFPYAPAVTVRHIWEISPSESDASDWADLLTSAGRARLDDGVKPVLSPVRRYGVALIPAANGPGRLALFMWPHFDLVLLHEPTFDEEAVQLDYAASQIAERILQRHLPGYAPNGFGQVSVAPLGSAVFRGIAATVLEDLVGAVVQEHSCWDPLLTDEIYIGDAPSDAPKGTVAAAIERNLLHADEAGQEGRRIDRILLNDIAHLVAQARAHREEMTGRAVGSRDRLFDDWTANELE